MKGGEEETVIRMGRNQSLHSETLKQDRKNSNLVTVKMGNSDLD